MGMDRLRDLRLCQQEPRSACCISRRNEIICRLWPRWNWIKSSKNPFKAFKTHWNICIEQYPRLQDAATEIKGRMYNFRNWGLRLIRSRHQARKQIGLALKTTIMCGVYIKRLGIQNSGISGTLRCPHASRFMSTDVARKLFGGYAGSIGSYRIREWRPSSEMILGLPYHRDTHTWKLLIEWFGLDSAENPGSSLP